MEPGRRGPSGVQRLCAHTPEGRGTVLREGVGDLWPHVRGALLARHARGGPGARLSIKRTP